MDQIIIRTSPERQDISGKFYWVEFIKIIPCDIDQFFHIVNIILLNNLIREVPIEVTNMAKLRSIELGDNIIYDKLIDTFKNVKTLIIGSHTRTVLIL